MSRPLSHRHLGGAGCLAFRSPASPAGLEALSSAPAWISLGQILSRPWICCQVEHIYFTSCQCFPFQIIFVVFTLWKYCYDYYECSSVRVAENWLDGFMPAGSHENSWAGGSTLIRLLPVFQSSLAVPLHPCLPVPPALSYFIYIFPSRLSLGHSVSCFFLHFSNFFICFLYYILSLLLDNHSRLC